jgi:phosphatidylserine/phosphatidylglycerophosphate/cardiolipin synthase-like enzyme
VKLRSASTSTSAARTVRARLLADAEHYEEIVMNAIANAKVSLWIATANVKELRIEAPIGTRARAAGKYISILDTFTSLARRGVEIRLLHATIPSRPFRAELARHRDLTAPQKGSRGLEMKQCPRVHLKIIAVDGRLLYLGSANFTGAGLGAKGEGRRNFEMGILTDDDVWLDAAQARFHRVWSGSECKGCKLRNECPRPIDMMGDMRTAPRAPISETRLVAKAIRKRTTRGRRTT